MKSTSTLTISNKVEGKLLVKMDLRIDDEQSITATLLLDDSHRESSVAHLEHAVFARLEAISKRIDGL